MEEPDEQCAHLDDLIVEGLAADVVEVDAGVAGRDAEGQLVAAQQLHGVNDLLVGAFAAAAVVGLLKALQADGGDEVLHPQHLLTEGLVDQGTVGEGEELTVGVHLADLDQVGLAHHGLAAGVNVHIGAQLLALGDDGVDGFQGEVELMAVFRSPATGAVEVAGRGGIQQNGPGHIAVVLGGRLLLKGAALQAGVEDKVLEEGLAHARVQLIDPQDQLIPVVLLLDGGAESVALGHIPVVRGELIHQIHDLGDVALRVFSQVAQSGVDRGSDGRVFGFVGKIHRETLLG